MAHRLWVLDAFSVPVTRPHPDLPAAAEPVVADPHDGLGAMVGRALKRHAHSPTREGRVTSTCLDWSELQDPNRTAAVSSRKSRTESGIPGTNDYDVLSTHLGIAAYDSAPP
jgi:hypothetical protein